MPFCNGTNKSLKCNYEKNIYFKNIVVSIHMNMLEINVKYRIELKTALVSLNYCKFFQK